MKHIVGSFITVVTLLFASAGFAHNNFDGSDGLDPSQKRFTMHIDGASVPPVPHGDCNGNCKKVHGVEGGNVVAYTHDDKVLATGIVGADGYTVMTLTEPTTATTIIVRNIRVTLLSKGVDDAWAWFGDEDVCPGNKTEDGYVCANLIYVRN